MVVLCILFGLVILQSLYLLFLNRRNAKKRIANGKTGPHVDYSLENSNKWAAMKAKRGEKVGGEEGIEHEEEMVNSHAFDDLTDLKNEDFIYSL